VDGEISEQLLRRSLAADNSDRLLQQKRRLDESVRNELWQDVGYPHHEPQRATARLSTKGLPELLAEREDLVGVPQGNVTDIREEQAAAGAPEQIFPEGFLEIANLRTDGLGRQVQFLAGTGEVAFVRDGPEQP